MNSPNLHPEQDYFSHLAEGRFMLQRSRSSGKFFFPPRIAEPSTGALDLEWVAVSGRGVVHAVTLMHPKPPQNLFNVALIDLAEGPRIMSRVENIAPDAVHIGMIVQARIGVQDGKSILLFDPVSGNNAY